MLAFIENFIQIRACMNVQERKELWSEFLWDEEELAFLIMLRLYNTALSHTDNTNSFSSKYNGEIQEYSWKASTRKLVKIKEGGGGCKCAAYVSLE